MNTVKRAIIVAAGKGTRLRPVTDETPKPLVRVNGTRMLDTVIHGLHKNGIFEIYVVVGYLKEQFYSLEAEYEGVKLIENPYYDSSNNISSLYSAREHLDDVVIIDADQIVKNPEALSAGFERSGYNAVWTDEKTDEWLMTLEGDTVRSCSRTGGEKGWQLFGISRWTHEDGQKLKQQLEVEFEQKKNRQIYWDEIPLFCHADSFELGIREMNPGDVAEIDDIDELVRIDPSYKKYLEGEKD